jgi:CRP-like cAMP-binding protein
VVSAALFDQNHLLRRLPDDVRERLQPHLRQRSYERGQILLHPHQPIAEVYFPVDMMVSLLTVFDDGSMIEAGVVGNEGMVGLPRFFGVNSMANVCVIQATGTMLVLVADVFEDELRRNGALRDVTGRFAQAFMCQLAQCAACNRRHTLEARLARWLLMTRDRVGRDEFPITHQMLGQMLGVRRAGVTVAANALQQSGAISYRRSSIAILDHAELEARACDCYRAIRSEYTRLLGPDSD